METILTGNIWKQVAQEARMAKRRLLAVAYVSRNTYLDLKRGDILICDASDHAIETRETSARLLHTLFRKGVELRSRPDLHAKVAVFGRYALVGSCNLSSSSEKDLTELAILTDRKTVVAQATAFVHGLRDASEKIDRDFLRRILSIKVQAVQRPRRSRRNRTIYFGNRVWLVSVHELAENSFPKEQLSVEEAQREAESLAADKDRRVSWIRLTGKTRFRSLAQPGDRVIQIWRTLSGKRTTVFAPCPLVLRRDSDNWTRLWIAEPDDCQSLSWGRFEKEVQKRGLSRVSMNSVRQLNPREILLIDRIWK